MLETWKPGDAAVNPVEPVVKGRDAWQGAGKGGGKPV